MSEKSNKLSICLVKDGHTSFDQIIEADAKFIELEGIGTFYVEESHPVTPGWVSDFFGSLLDGQFKLLTASSKGVLLTTIESGGTKYTFAIIFGHGRHLLRDGVIEDRFGLKVVLNTVQPTSLRSIDKTTLGSVPKQSREQVSRASAAANFGIDIEQDLLGAVTGLSNDARFGKTISGRDALAVSVKIDVTQIKEFLLLCLERFHAQDYQQNFDWVDQIKDVRSGKLITELDAIVVERINEGKLDKIWMAPPDIMDWVDVKGFRYGKRKRADLYSDLDVSEFLAVLGGSPISFEILQETSVYAISERSGDAFAKWSVYRCLYVELDLNNKVFILHSGKWYEIAKTFTDEVLQSFVTTAESSVVLPDYSHTDEGSYNQSLPGLVANSHCMDCDVITHGGGHSKIEFCDLMTSDKRLIHIKRYSGSQQLSHLFAQGVVSGELFVQDAEFRRKLNEKVPEHHRLPDAVTRPDASQYEIVFAIISKSINPLDIPFFAKVSLRNARKRLEGYGYRVSKKKIAKAALPR